MISLACRLLFLLLFCCLSASATPASKADLLEGDAGLRRAFLEAVEALSKGQQRRYQKRLEKLRKARHPLLPWLEEKALTRRLSHLGDSEIRTFFEHAKGTPPARRFRRRLLRHLARTKQWRRYLRYQVATTSPTWRCHGLHARLRTGRLDEKWYAEAIELWNVGHSQPDACDPVFRHLYAEGRITPPLLWERIEKAMRQGRLTLARWLGRKLPANQQVWVQRWILAHRHPERALESAWAREETPLSRKLTLHAIERLSRRDPLRAHRRLMQATRIHTFPAGDYYRVLGRIALRAAREGEAAAQEWLKEIPIARRTRAQQEWRIRNALMRERWDQVIEAIEALPRERREEPEWQYWYGVAHARLGYRERAMVIHSRLARQRNYHGFLAAEALGEPFRFNHRPIPATPEDLADLLEQHPLLAAARDLYRIGWIDEARRAWEAGTAGLTKRALQHAAVLAHRLGWHDRAIFTAARSGHTDDLEIRFPLAHRSLVEQQARATGLDITWIYGIMRQESAFMHDARSGAGALGLMQLMPSTGRRVARLLKRPSPTRRSLLAPRTNVHLGTAYLRRLLDEFESQALASAAYNAGPQRVRTWLRERQGKPDPRLLIDTLPYAETRGYVRAVLAFATVYRHRLGLRPIRIAYRLGLTEKRLASMLDPDPKHPTDSGAASSSPLQEEDPNPWTEASSASSAAPASSAATSPTGWAAAAITCGSRAAAPIATAPCASTRPSP